MRNPRAIHLTPVRGQGTLEAVTASGTDHVPCPLPRLRGDAAAALRLLATGKQDLTFGED